MSWCGFSHSVLDCFLCLQMWPTSGRRAWLTTASWSGRGSTRSAGGTSSIRHLLGRPSVEHEAQVSCRKNRIEWPQFLCCVREWNAHADSASGEAARRTVCCPPLFGMPRGHPFRIGQYIDGKRHPSSEISEVCRASRKGGNRRHRQGRDG